MKNKRKFRCRTLKKKRLTAILLRKEMLIRYRRLIAGKSRTMEFKLKVKIRFQLNTTQIMLGEP